VRILVTGAGGFVGSNVVHEGAARGFEMVGLVRSLPPRPDPNCAYATVNLSDRAATRDIVGRTEPAAIVHTAILNDFGRIYADRPLAWDSYVGVTRTLADLANELGAQLLTVSTDWVFDGTEGGYDETAPPNPVNFYGFLKAMSEMVTLERARLGTVARLAAVFGTHRARPELPRRQDVGFGYFVGSLVDALESGETFTVWEDDAINMRATPSLASHSARLMLELCRLKLTGIYHCVGGEAATRSQLAHATAETFDLDLALVRAGPPDPGAVPSSPVPYDTSLEARATGAALGTPLPTLCELLALYGAERASASA
jgi:dTDP-4-dehydrorhamnose reductase